MLVAYLFLLFELMRKMKQSSAMRKWQNYVLIVLKEIEDEMTKNNQLKFTIQKGKIQLTFKKVGLH